MLGVDQPYSIGGTAGKAEEGRLKTTNEELRKLMDKHKLRIKDVANMLEVSVDTVKGWRRYPESAR